MTVVRFELLSPDWKPEKWFIQQMRTANLKQFKIVLTESLKCIEYSQSYAIKTRQTLHNGTICHTTRGIYFVFSREP